MQIPACHALRQRSSRKKWLRGERGAAGGEEGLARAGGRMLGCAATGREDAQDMPCLPGFNAPALDHQIEELFVVDPELR